MICQKTMLETHPPNPFSWQEKGRKSPSLLEREGLGSTDHPPILEDLIGLPPEVGEFFYDTEYFQFQILPLHDFCGNINLSSWR
jgi:hypothetical protein